MKTIIAGGREFRDFDRAYKELDKIHKKTPITEVLCGMALHWLWKDDPFVGGADRAGYNWAKKRGIPLTPYPAAWREQGSGAGFVRNGEMASDTEQAVVIWDGISKGSRNMVKLMHNLDKPVIVISY